MSFLGAGFLLALPLIAAPLLLHLFDRRRNDEIQWAAMQFLMAAATRKTSSRRLKHWLLLLLRTLAVAALVFAFARPLIHGGWLGGSQRSETIVIIDNSMSMTRRADDETMIQRAIQRAERELTQLKTGDRVRLMTTAPYPAWHQAGSMRSDDHSQDWIASQLESVQPTLGKSDLLAALFTAVQADADVLATSRRIVVLSDGQAADWRLSDEALWDGFRQTLSQAAIPTQLELVELQTDGPSKGNVAIDGISANRTLVGIDQPVTLSAQIHNYGATSVASRPVTWRVGGLQSDEDIIDLIESGESTQIQWTHSFSSPGIHAVTCQIESDDDVAADNSATIVIEVVDSVAVLIVEGTAELADTQQDAFFVRAALGWIGDQPLDAKAVYGPTTVALEQIAAMDLTPFHAVIIPNLTALENKAIEALRQFVAAGGGVWVGLGARVDIDTFNQQWFADGNGLAPLAIDRIVDEGHRSDESAEHVGAANDEETNASQQRARTTINPFGPAHPATKWLADIEQLDIGEVIVDRRLRFVTSEHHDTSVVLSLSNGQSLAVENFFGRGRVIVQAIPLRLQWSSLVRSQAFVVMVRDWIDYLAQPSATSYNLQPGDPIVLRLPKSASPFGMLTPPQGDPIELTADGVDGEVMFRSSRTRLPGDYRIEVGIAGEQIPFHVSRDPRESDLTPLRSTERNQLVELTGLEPATSSTSFAGSLPTDPLWPYLLIGLIGLITGELLLSGLLARERFGSSGLIETTEDFSSEFGTRAPARSFNPLHSPPSSERGAARLAVGERQEAQ